MNNHELTEAQVETVKNLVLQDGEFRVSFTKAVVSDPKCVGILIGSLLASLHEAIGQFAVKKVLQIGWALLFGVFAWFIAKGYIQVKL